MPKKTEAREEEGEEEGEENLDANWAHRGAEEEDKQFELRDPAKHFSWGDWRSPSKEEDEHEDYFYW